jgi:effector-binding domain-containing protein
MPTQRTRPKAKPAKAGKPRKTKASGPAKARATAKAGKPAKARATAKAGKLRAARKTARKAGRPASPSRSAPTRAALPEAPRPAARAARPLRLIEPPQITQTAAQPMAYIHLEIPREQIREAMGPGISEVISTCNAQGVTITGPWFTHHLRLLPDRWDFDICVPVATAVKAAGRVRPGVRPARDAVRTIYRGGYERLGDAWGEFKAWIAAQGLPAAPDILECYLVGPESGPDTSKYETELTQPLQR